MGFKISFSAVEKYNRCPKKYYYYYNRKIRSKNIGSALIFGSAVDASLSSLLVDRDIVKANNIFLEEWSSYQFTGEDKKTKVLGDNRVKYSNADNETHFIPDYDKRFLNGDKNNDSWFSLKHKGLLMLQTYKDVVLPHIKVTKSVQEPVLLTNAEGDIVRGFIDLIAIWEYDPTYPTVDAELKKYNGMTVVFDDKTSSQTYKDTSVRDSAQLGTYFFYVCEHIGKADKAGFIVLNKSVRKKKLPPIRVQVIIDDVNPDIINETFHNYNEVLHKIKEGEFPKNLDGCMNKYGKCMYYNYCNNVETDEYIELKKD